MKTIIIVLILCLFNAITYAEGNNFNPQDFEHIPSEFRQLLTPEFLQHMTPQDLNTMMKIAQGDSHRLEPYEIQSLVNHAPDGYAQLMAPQLIHAEIPPGYFNKEGQLTLSEEIKNTYPQIILSNSSQSVILNEPKSEAVIKQIVLKNESTLNNTRINNIINAFVKQGDIYNRSNVEQVLNNINYLRSGLAYSAIKNINQHEIILVIGIKPYRDSKTILYTYNYGDEDIGILHTGIVDEEFNVNGDGSLVYLNYTQSLQNKNNFKDYYFGIKQLINNKTDLLFLEFEQNTYKINKYLYDFCDVEGSCILAKGTYIKPLRMNDDSKQILNIGFQYKSTEDTLTNMQNLNYSTYSYEEYIGLTSIYQKAKQRDYFSFTAFHGNIGDRNDIGRAMNEANQTTDSYYRGLLTNDYMYDFNDKWRYHNKLAIQLASNNVPAIFALHATGPNACKGYHARDLFLNNGIFMRNEFIYIYPKDKHLTFSLYHDIVDGDTTKWEGTHIQLQDIGFQIQYMDIEKWFVTLDICMPIAGKNLDFMRHDENKCSVWCIFGWIM